MLALASSTLDCTRLGFVVLRATATIWGKRKLNCTHTAAGETPNSPQSAVNFSRHAKASGRLSRVILT